MQFTANFTKVLCASLRIKQAMSMAYHPQMDGQMERLNQELKQYLRTFCNLCQTDWSALLATAEFSHNSRVHSTTEHSPFEALMGFNPRSLPSALPPTSVPSITERLVTLTQLRSDLITAQTIAHRQWKSTAAPLPYKLGDLVWLEGKHLKTSYPSYKLAPRRHGPFPITRCINDTTFGLSLPRSWKIHPVFHTSLLSAYHETNDHGPNFTQPPPDLIDGDEHFEVEAILDSRFYRCALQYLVHWKGYPSSDDQWLPAAELTSAPDLVSSFHTAHPTAASPFTIPALTRR